MNTSLSATAGSRATTVPSYLWLNNKTWDLTFISLSAGLVILPFAAYEIFQYLLGVSSIRSAIGVGSSDILDVSRNTVNGFIALFIGGPHMYATFTRTFLDTDFRKHHVFFLLASLIIPCAVVYLGVFDFRLLVTAFFFWASVHVMHQMGYIIDCYNNRSPKRISLQSRIIDYTVVFSSLYPIGVWRMLNGSFMIGKIQLKLPQFMMMANNPTIAWAAFLLVTMVFGVSLTLWVWKTYREYMRGELHGPKVLLMSLTIIVAFFIPAYRELDVSFQGFNTWHSFQYLGLTLYINRLRGQKEGIHSSLVRNISLAGKGWKFYAFNVACALGAVLLIGLLLVNKSALGFSFDQCYYTVVLSFLLMHYLHDHLLFAERDALSA